MGDWKIRFREGQQCDCLVNSLLSSTRNLSRYLDLIESSFNEVFDDQFDPLTIDGPDGLSEQERRKIPYSSLFNRGSFSREFYNSFVMSLYSKIERELLEFCEREVELKLLVSPFDTEYMGKGIYRAQKFMAQAAGYVIDTHLWRELQVIGKVRNYLVHSDFSYTATAQKPKNGNVTKIHVELGTFNRDYFLQIDSDLYKHVSKLKILNCAAAFEDPENELALFELLPSYEYCRYLIDFRKKLFLHIYNGFLNIAKSL